jgi:hypothetical protein
MWRALVIVLMTVNIFTPRAAKALDMNFMINEEEKLLYMHLWGTIVPGDGEKFRSLVLPYIKQGYLLFEVRVFTGGGDVGAAMSIGDQVRTLQAMTEAPTEFVNEPGYVQCWFVNWAGKGGIGFSQDHNIKTSRSTGEGPNWCTCASACFLIWASGSSRSGNVVGIHRIRPNTAVYGRLSVAEAREVYERIEREYREYVSQLNVPASIVDRMFATEYGSMYWLNRSELQLLTGTPYLEELENARCPPDRTKVEYDSYGNWVSTTEDPVRINCNREILKEMMRDGARQYMAKYGDGGEIIASPPRQPLQPQQPGVGGPFVPVPIGPAASDKYWDHNGSQMDLIASGSERKFVYRNPRAGLREEGVDNGTVLFVGKRIGDEYSGTAYLFSKSCGKQSYAVSGPVGTDQRSVTMHGNRPVLNGSCQIEGYRDDVLVFNYLGQ